MFSDDRNSHSLPVFFWYFQKFEVLTPEIQTDSLYHKIFYWYQKIKKKMAKNRHVNKYSLNPKEIAELIARLAFWIFNKILFLRLFEKFYDYERIYKSSWNFGYNHWNHLQYTEYNASPSFPLGRSCSYLFGIDSIRLVDKESQTMKAVIWRLIMIQRPRSGLLVYRVRYKKCHIINWFFDINKSALFLV